MSGQHLLAYWLEFADAAAGPLADPARGPLSPSAVRHDNRDLVVACFLAGEHQDVRRARLARWQAYWERQTGQPLVVRCLEGTVAPV
jgi:hypothetical protein